MGRLAAVTRADLERGLVTEDLEPLGTQGAGGERLGRRRQRRTVGTPSAISLAR